MAFRAAMTGHQVYSTLHTNSAAGGDSALLDIGIVRNVLAATSSASSRSAWWQAVQALQNKPTRQRRRMRHASVRKSERAPTLLPAVGCDQCDYQAIGGRMASSRS